MLSSNKIKISGNTSPYIKRKSKKYWCYNCMREFNKILISSQELECPICHNSVCEEIIPEENNKNLSSISNSTNTSNSSVNKENKPSNNSQRNKSPSPNPSNPPSLQHRSYINTLPPQDYIPYNTHIQQNEDELIFRVNRNNSYLGQIIEELMYLQYENEEIEYILNYLLNYNQIYSPPPTHPASKEAVETLPIYIINKEKLESFGNENVCPVCKEEFQINQEGSTLPCHHYFHKECILPWFTEHNSCPICRFELPTDDEDYERLKKERMQQGNENH
ncbi:MAG: hypothetical protein MJ252_16730 [archaeon]|nr:hypothetical protein [archaeon]